MKLLLLKILLQRRAKDEGFTLPMVIALGLVMLLLGTTSIVKSNEENIAAINTNSSSDALAIAEVGVARYRELLNQNRILTIYNENQWDTNPNIVGSDLTVTSDDQTCNDVTKTPPGWFDDNNAGTDVAPNSTNQWWEVKQDKDDDSIGEYRLISYEYDRDGTSIREDLDGDGNPDDATPDNENGVFSVLSDANIDDDTSTLAFGVTAGSITDENDTDDNGESNAKGILTVQGRSSDGSEAQIQVDIPLRINDFNNFAPLLWVGSGSITSVGGTDKLNLENGNIVMSNPGGNCPGLTKIDGNNVINDSRDLPDIIDDPDGEAAIPASGLIPAIPAVPAMDSDKKNSISINDTTDSSDPSTDPDFLLPRPNSTPDKKNDDGRFYYRAASNININNNKLETDGVAKVTLYIDSVNLDITGPATIGNYNPNVSSGTVSSHNLEIYIDGNQTIDIDTGSGTVNIEAFIHAPNSTLNITGSGTVNINGAVWVANYNNAGGATVNIRRDKTDTATGSEAAYKFYTTTANRTPRPLTSSPTNWVKEEVE